VEISNLSLSQSNDFLAGGNSSNMKHTRLYFFETNWLHLHSYGSCVNITSSISVQLKNSRILSESHFHSHSRGHFFLEQ
jgi:hypothetical protein